MGLTIKLKLFVSNGLFVSSWRTFFELWLCRGMRRISEIR